MKTIQFFSRTIVAALFFIQTTNVHAQGKPQADKSIRPFKVQISETDLNDMKARINATKWPDMETVSDQSQGAKLANMKELAQYWGNEYDWRKAEAKLNTYPQFKTEIDGVDIHFIHIKSKHQNAMPMIMTHGWPGSVFEFMSVIDPLTDPVAYGGKPQDAFDLVIPSLPGFGFSGKPMDAGWNNERIAKAWIVLMDRLGYKKYVAQGGDWGAGIVQRMALAAPNGLLAIHSNLPATLPKEAGMALGGEAPAEFSAKERASFNQLNKAIKTGWFTYKTTMESRPQGVGYALSDSPTGLAAWLFLHPGFENWSFGKDAQQFPTKDQVLDNVSLYWLTGSAASAAKIYYENRGTNIISADAMESNRISIPVAVSTFPQDVYASPETWAKRAYKNLAYFNEVEKGGHFAAWEQPQLFTGEIRAAFRFLQ